MHVTWHLRAVGKAKLRVYYILTINISLGKPVQKEQHKYVTNETMHVENPHQASLHVFNFREENNSWKYDVCKWWNKKKKSANPLIQHF